MGKIRTDKTGKILWQICLLSVLLSLLITAGAHAADTENIKSCYAAYRRQFENIHYVEDIEKNGYRILEDQVFASVLESFGEQELTLLPALETTWHRLALFLADETGKIVYKCSQLETNNRILGSLSQPVDSIAAVSFYDVDKDGLTDIILITRCVNETGAYAGIPYKVGDVLFQGERTFYRDWHISDQINRFSMNKSAAMIISCVRDGRSAEFLYTATTLEELVRNGFFILEDQCYTRDFEKLGRLTAVPGIYRISVYDFFMVYLVNSQGEIVWSFQPMKDCDSLYALKGVTGRDVDGDGMKDLVVLASYTLENPKGEQTVENRCGIYYQRTGGFEEDTEFESYYQYREEDTMEDLVWKIRGYWGWQKEE